MGTNYKELHSLQEQVRRCTGDLRFSSQAWRHHHSSTILQQSWQLEARVHTAHDTSFPNKVVCRTLQWAPLMISCWRKKKEKMYRKIRERQYKNKAEMHELKHATETAMLSAFDSSSSFPPFTKRPQEGRWQGEKPPAVVLAVPSCPCLILSFPACCMRDGTPSRRIGGDFLNNWLDPCAQWDRQEFCPKCQGKRSSVAMPKLGRSRSLLLSAQITNWMHSANQLGKKKNIKKVFQQGWDVFKHLNASMLITQKENIAMMQETPRTATGCNAI